MADRSAEAASGRLVERAFVLTLLAFILFTPPILTIFDVPVLIFGVPLLHVYCFAAWLAVIVGGRWLSLRLASSSARPADPTLPDGA